VIDPPFVSYAQNGEDVILWRALRGVTAGRYLDVGAYDPIDDSVTKAFYDRGWRGVSVEPLPDAAERLRADRPGDEIVEAAITADGPGELTIHQFVGTGLSTLVDEFADRHQGLGFERRDLLVATTGLDAVIEGSAVLGDEIHFLKIDVEGLERDVILSIDLRKHRPWIIVVEATEPDSTKPSHEQWEELLLAADYEFGLFDGLSRYYTAVEHSDLKPSLSYGACVLDNYVRASEIRSREAADQAAQRAATLWDDVVHWRGVALHAWSDGFGKVEELEERRVRLRTTLKRRNREVRELNAEVNWMRNSLSWRLTKPLRWVRSRRTPKAAVRGDAER
jgi:FkbM family methyltransferase